MLNLKKLLRVLNRGDTVIAFNGLMPSLQKRVTLAL